MTQDVYLRVPSTAIRQAYAQLPQAARAGGNVADAMMVRCGMALLGRIKDAFIIKARGGTDEAGDSWVPLKPETIAYSRRHRKLEGDPGESPAFSRAQKKPWIPKQEKRPSLTSRTNRRSPSYSLTKAQTARWWEVYRKYLAIHKGNKGRAAATAWAILKDEGAHTLIGLFGGQQVDILRDTGLLLNSLSPGVKSENQVFRVNPGSVIVGTNRKHAGVHHHGSKGGRIPQRRLWPEPKKWPKSWWQDITDQLKQGLVDLFMTILARFK